MPEEAMHPLRAAREARNLSQKDLAEAVGLGPRTIWAAEHGKPISAHSRRRLSRYFKQSAQQLGLVTRSSSMRAKQHQRAADPVTITAPPEALSPALEPVLEPVPLNTVDSLYADSLLIRAMIVIHQWSHQTASYDELQRAIDQEIRKADHMNYSRFGDDSKLSRRDALVMIAGLPLSLLVKTRQAALTPPIAEEFLSQCAASITACWYLMRGNQLSVVREVLVAYLPVLTTLARQPSRYQKMAANLVTQGYRLNGILALHQNDLRSREHYCQQALQYSKVAEHPSLIVSALISLASTFYYSDDPAVAAHIYQQGLNYMKEIPPLLLSRLYFELAVVYAQQQQEQEALRFLGLAQQVYPEHPEDDPSFLYAEFSPSSMILEEGLAYLALAQYYPDKLYAGRAWETFARIEASPTFIVPERIRLEIVNLQAKTTLTLGEIDSFCNYLARGVSGARALRSAKRQDEAITIYKEARRTWPDESRVKELADLFF